MLSIPNEQIPTFLTIVCVYLCMIILIALRFFINFYYNYKALNQTVNNRKHHFLDIKDSSIWTLAFFTSSLFFFQIHTHIPTLSVRSVVNVNLADPFAIIALLVVLLEFIKTKKMPSWRAPNLNYFLIGITFVLIFGFLNALPEIGITSWALISRLFGWFVILGYLSLGYLITSHFGLQAIKKFVEILATVAAVIILVQLLLRSLVSLGYIYDINLTYNFEGYSGNRNAFALQLLACVCFYLVYSTTHSKVKKIKIYGRLLSYQETVISSVIIMGLVLTNSLAGIGTGIIIIMIAILLMRTPILTVIKPCLVAIVIFLFLTLVLPFIANYIATYINTQASNDTSITNNTPSSRTPSSNTLLSNKDYSQDKTNNAVEADTKQKEPTVNLSIYSFESSRTRLSSNNTRLQTIKNGLNLWFENPLFGAGLGAAINDNYSWSKRPIAIHNTIIWILAELGLLGILVIGGMFLYIGLSVFQWDPNNPQRRIIIFLLPTFIIISQVHEVFYQRIFWLSLGLTLAVPYIQTQKLSPTN